MKLILLVPANLSGEELEPVSADETTVEAVPDFLPSDNEDDDDERPDETDDSTTAPYVPPHMPKFPSRHSFKQTPVCENCHYNLIHPSTIFSDHIYFLGLCR